MRAPRDFLAGRRSAIAIVLTVLAGVSASLLVGRWASGQGVSSDGELPVIDLPRITTAGRAPDPPPAAPDPPANQEPPAAGAPPAATPAPVDDDAGGGDDDDDDSEADDDADGAGDDD